MLDNSLASRAARLVRLIKKLRKNQLTTQVPTKEFKQHHTRASYGHKYLGRLVPIDLDEPPEQTPYNPGWEPPLRTMAPNFKERNVTHFWVIFKMPDGTEKLIRNDFRVLCSQGKSCKRKGCAICWVANHLSIPKGITVIIREAPSNQKIEIYDPAAVDTHGFRPRGKSLGDPERDLYRLTSTQTKYKGDVAAQ